MKMDSPSKESLSEDSSCPERLELARPHHRLKHTLPDQPRARALLMEKLKAKHASKAARSITRRKQHELRELFRAVFGVETQSNNSQWLRRKLLEVLQVPMDQYLDRVQTTARRRTKKQRQERSATDDRSAAAAGISSSCSGAATPATPEDRATASMTSTEVPEGLRRAPAVAPAVAAAAAPGQQQFASGSSGCSVSALASSKALHQAPQLSFSIGGGGAQAPLMSQATAAYPAAAYQHARSGSAGAVAAASAPAPHGWPGAPLAAGSGNGSGRQGLQLGAATSALRELLQLPAAVPRRPPPFVPAPVPKPDPQEVLSVDDLILALSQDARQAAPGWPAAPAPRLWPAQQQGGGLGAPGCQAELAGQAQQEQQQQ